MRIGTRMMPMDPSAGVMPEVVADRMLKRITIFSGVPLLFGFSTGPIFYGLKVLAHADVAPWQFFVASTATRDLGALVRRFVS